MEAQSTIKQNAESNGDLLGELAEIQLRRLKRRNYYRGKTTDETVETIRDRIENDPRTIRIL